MTGYIGDNDFDHSEIPAVGVLLTNVGTPDAPTTPALRKYLQQFLSDPRVIENQGLMWKLILHGIILRTRPQRSAEGYKKTWTPDGSPLLTIGHQQATLVQKLLRERFGSPIHVALGMGYGSPSIASALDQLRQKSCRRIVVLPLFPQYAGATVGSTFDAVAKALISWRWVPELRFVNHYHDDPGYIDALAASVGDAWAEGKRGDRLLISFHGLPKRYFTSGDPYHCQCIKTARLLTERLELKEDEWLLSFQSRFGREEWLQPYTDETLKTWGAGGVKSVDVICPGFSADCLETIEEIGVENRDYFLQAGGQEFRYIPALNSRPDHVEALADIAAQNLTGWSVDRTEWDEKAAQKAARTTSERAEALRSQSRNA